MTKIPTAHLISFFDDIELFLFDMDGTLVNTEPLHAKAMDIVLKKAGISLSISEEEAMERFKGMTDTLVLKALCPEIDESKREKMIEDKNQILKVIFKNLTEQELHALTSPGIREFLQSIKQQGKKLAVVSASENEVVYETLHAFRLYHEFDFWFGRGSTERTKPHPDPYIEAIKKANIAKERTVIFEDSPTGLTAARAAGTKIIEVAPFGKENYLKDFRSLLAKN